MLIWALALKNNIRIQSKLDDSYLIFKLQDQQKMPFISNNYYYNYYSQI